MEYHYPEMCLPEDQILVNEYGTEYMPTYLLSSGDYQQLGTVLSDGGDRYGVSTVIFDKSEELIWMGNQGGHVTSYYGPTMQKYTSFQVHESEEVRQMATVDQGILALTKSSLRYQLRRGIPKHTHRSANMNDMQCLLQIPPNKILMGGHQDKFIELDLVKMTETVSDITPNDCVVLSCSGGSLLAAGSSSGLVSLKDPRCPASSVHEFLAHAACLSDLAIQGDTLITCGFVHGMGGAVAEEEVLVWDSRALREGRGAGGAGALGALRPGEGAAGAPLQLHFLPAVSGKAAVLTSSGYVFVLDLNSAQHQNRTFAFQVDTQNSVCSSFDVSSTSQAFVFGDHTGHIHLFSPQHNSEPFFNNFSRETEFADPIENLPYSTFLDENFPLSSVPLPPLTTGSKWFSDWPDEFLKNVYRRPKPIDPEVLASMKMQGPIGYAPNPRTSLRNQMPYQEENFSEIKRPNVVTSDYDDVFTPIPKRYHKVEIRYAKHTNSDTEFDHYNKTGFPGLEATLPNSYCNSMLQVLYYTQSLKRALLQHTCAKEFCLCCELGFLFRMLDTSMGAPCQASNFLRAFRTVPEAAALGLVLPDGAALADVDLAALLQSWSRFILHQLHSELVEAKRKMPANPHSFPDDFPISEEFSNSININSDANKKESRRDAEVWDRVLLTQDEDYNRYLWVVPAEQQASGMHGSFRYDVKNGAGDNSNAKKLESSDTNKDNAQTNDLKHSNREETEISELFGIKQFKVNRCLKCNREEHRECVLLACALQYPGPNNANAGLSSPVKDGSMSEVDNDTDTGFSGLVRGALAARRTTPAWCETCRRFRLTAQRAMLQSLPPVLVINCGGLTPNEKAYWSAHSPNRDPGSSENGKERSPTTPPNARPCRYGSNCARPGCHFKHPDKLNKSRESNQASADSSPSSTKCSVNSKKCWIPYKLNIKMLEDRDVSVEAIWEDKITPPRPETSEKQKNEYVHNQELMPSDTVEYNLYAVVCSVDDSPKNIISFVKMDSSSNSDGKPQWYLFNDVSITAVNASEAACYVPAWKRPCVLLYGGVGGAQPAPPSPAPPAPSMGASPAAPPAPRALWAPPRSGAPRSTRRRPSSVTFTPLAAHETPTQGMLVGMDAEFVTLNPEEVELRSNGQLSTIRPSHMSVARITCVRGQGPLEGTPFIDDYISTQEQVVDYMTKFSGIKPGDLDANFSSKHLTTLKSTYQKLRYLVDSGVIFVGHGLKNDFRVINLVVPPEQIIDTVQLFHLPHHRMVSLKFLAWHFLGLRIQTETHDSAEDACTALRLRKVWAELGGSGELRHALTALYHTGETSAWTVPPP